MNHAFYIAAIIIGILSLVFVARRLLIVLAYLKLKKQRDSAVREIIKTSSKKDFSSSIEIEEYRVVKNSFKFPVEINKSNFYHGLGYDNYYSVWFATNSEALDLRVIVPVGFNPCEVDNLIELLEENNIIL